MLNNVVMKRRLIFGGMCTVGVGLASLHFLPNTYFIDRLKDVVQMYRYGLPVPISEKVSKMFETVMNDMKINPEDRERIQPFTMYGFDMFRAGCVHTNYGAIVGVPSNFYYSCLEDIETENITVMNRQVDWLSSCAKKFKESLLLSDEAQKFLIAREIASVNSCTVLLKSLYPFSTVLIVYSLAYQCNTQLQLLTRPRVLRGILYTIVSLFGFGMWAFSHDFTTAHLEEEADKAACALGEQYVRGGLEAYSKLIQRNICLRELMGSKGNSVYTTSGNDQYFFRQKHLPLSYRKAYMEKLLNESKSETKIEASRSTTMSNS